MENWQQSKKNQKNSKPLLRFPNRFDTLHKSLMAKKFYFIVNPILTFIFFLEFIGLLPDLRVV